jgi:hypothetical protein
MGDRVEIPRIFVRASKLIIAYARQCTAGTVDHSNFAGSKAPRDEWSGCVS